MLVVTTNLFDVLGRNRIAINGHAVLIGIAPEQLFRDAVLVKFLTRLEVVMENRCQVSNWCHELEVDRLPTMSVANARVSLQAVMPLPQLSPQEGQPCLVLQRQEKSERLKE